MLIVDSLAEQTGDFGEILPGSEVHLSRELIGAASVFLSIATNHRVFGTCDFSDLMTADARRSIPVCDAPANLNEARVLPPIPIAFGQDPTCTRQESLENRPVRERRRLTQRFADEPFATSTGLFAWRNGQ